MLLATAAFVGTMIDNYFAFAAQLLLTDHKKFRQIGIAQGLGVAVLVLLSLALGSVLSFVPLRVFGVVALAPWALGLHAWRHRHDPARPVNRRGVITTLTMTLILGGDNIAVWVPLLRSTHVSQTLLSIATFVVLDTIFIVSAQFLTRHPKVVTWGEKWADVAVPWIYFLLGVLILFECGTV